MTRVSSVRSVALKADLVEDFFQHRHQAACADIFDAGIDLFGNPGQRADGLWCELQGHAFGRHQGNILLDQRGLWFCQNAFEIMFGQSALAPRGSADGLAILAKDQRVLRHGRPLRK